LYLLLLQSFIRSVLLDIYILHIYIKFSSSLISIGLRHVLFVSYYGPHIHKFHTFWASFFFWLNFLGLFLGLLKHCWAELINTGPIPFCQIQIPLPTIPRQFYSSHRDSFSSKVCLSSSSFSALLSQWVLWSCSLSPFLSSQCLNHAVFVNGRALVLGVEVQTLIRFKRESDSLEKQVD
jgi:hypothetical protein